MRTTELNGLGQLEKLKLPIRVPTSVEKWLGTSSEEAAVQESGGIFPNAAANEYVNSIGQQLVKRSSRPDFGYQFGIVSDPNPNAFALPNGSVYVTLGLLRLLRNEAQLANIIGHEVSHVTEQHTVNQMAFNAGTMGFLSFVTRIGQDILGKKGGSKADQETAKNLVFGLLSSGYSRDQEREADEVGQKLTSESGWDPDGMVDVFTIFDALQKDVPKDKLEAYMSSHPFPEERMKAAAARAMKLKRGELGVDRYQSFLRNQLNIAPAEVRQAPTSAAIQWLSTNQPGAFSAKNLIVPGIVAVGALGLLFFLWRSR